jgi:solute:Na+ symporter, SSS family
MDLSIYDYGVVILYIVALVAIAYSFSRKALDDENYLLAARRLSLPAFVMTLVTTWYGAILGVGEFIFGFGIVAWVVNGLVWYLVYLLFAVVIAKRIHDSKHLTIADQFREKVGKKSAKFAAFVTYIMTTPAPYVLSLALLLQEFFGIPIIGATILGLVISAAYIWSGGFRAVVRTDIFQFVFMYLGFGLLLVLSIQEFGGMDFLRNNLPETHLTFQGELPWQTIIVWAFLAFWTLVDPNFFQRCYAAKSAKVAKRGILYATVFWLIFDLLTLSTGLYARAAFPDSPAMFSYLTLSGAVMPVVLKGIFFVTILSIIMSTIDSFLFSSSSIVANDFLKKHYKNASLKRLARIGIIITLVISLIFIYLFQSIIGIIYAIGTVGVSALLAPMLLLLFTKKLKLSDNAILGSMIIASIVSGYWLIDGWMKSEYGWPNYLWGIEPMYLGIGTSLIVILFSQLIKKFHKTT